MHFQKYRNFREGHAALISNFQFPSTPQHLKTKSAATNQVAFFVNLLQHIKMELKKKAHNRWTYYCCCIVCEKKKKKDITFSNVSKFICLILSVLYVVVERRQQQTEPNFKLIEK